MTTHDKGDVVTVDGLRAGAICPTCNNPISEGERAVLCRRCGSFNHLDCWNTEGCGGYYCRPDHINVSDDRSVDIVITKADLAGIKESPPGIRHGSEALTAAIESQRKTRYSISSILAMLFGLAACSLSCWYLITQKANDPIYSIIFLLAIVGSLLSIVVSTLALALLQQNADLKGNSFAFVGLLTGIAALVLLFASMNSKSTGPIIGENFNTGKVLETIRTAQPHIRGPLMANVHIRVSSGYNTADGSGIALCNHENFTYVLTNAHVITFDERVKTLEALKLKNKTIKVTFYTGDTLDGVPVWLAPDGIDLALLRTTTPQGFKPLIKFSLNRPLSMGQHVFAIGNPMGLNWTYTEGVISALRTNRYGSRDLTVIQIQTPLNYGNSGGGLYDIDGYLIGVNTWVYTKALAEGLNFALSVDEFFKLLDPEWTKIIELPTTQQRAERDGG